MIIECRNPKKCFYKPILSALAKLNFQKFNFAYTHCNGHRQIFKENLLPNQRFGVEIVYIYTISTFYNHYFGDEENV